MQTFVITAMLCLAQPRLSGKQGLVPIYRDARRGIEERLDDLIQRMTIEEKAGQMFHTRLYQGPNGTLDEGGEELRRNSTYNMMAEKFLTHFNLAGEVNSIRESAEWVNRVQDLAAKTRLGIPVTLSSDPRHACVDNVATGFSSGRFSQWPEALGLAALRNPKWTQTFAEVAREEYIALGIRTALHPQVDLATEPRWGRIFATFGEDANLASELAVVYIKGFQGDVFGSHSVATVTKHFPGGGPLQNGEDSHFKYGKNQTYPGNNFNYFLIPFKAAIAAGTRRIMSYYSRPIGTQYPEVENRPELIVELIKKGQVSEQRIDQSVRKILREKFLLGLFENPYVDIDAAEKRIGSPRFVALGQEPQRLSYTLLSNKKNILPLQGSQKKRKFYIEGFNATYMEGQGLKVVQSPKEADFALLRLEAPYTPRYGPVENIFHAGSLEYNKTEKARQASIYAAVPTIVDVALTRPAIIPEVVKSSAVVMGNYGSSPDAFLDIVFGIARPEGKLPFDLPSSTKAVEESKEDVPFDTKDPVFRFGHGLSYKTSHC
ncbi:hypothetical protein LCI18_006142 [Fusarium solani-melongenae]|uniref:Uncharacterized protein n=1 Tax=Fusarium solani subsp. cucurbitae TaxID=2747967 RepID=A0ACD3Z1X8_FUSSC|nr:hypothetical protein LCI18_006142 [Fusarium solani-melongenae]